MDSEENYININRNAWDNKTKHHVESAFYNVPAFLAGANTLNSIELNLLGNIKGKSILHLQCHFGQDTISLARLGANVTGIDLSGVAISKANELRDITKTTCEFIECNIYDLPKHLNKTFDIVFTSYGTIGWLPDLDKWANIVQQYLKPKGKFVFVEFHPVVWMFDDDFEKVGYNYFNSGPIIETQEGTYADRSAQVIHKSVGWNHPTSEVLMAVLKNNLELIKFEEYDYSPYNCFKHTIEFEPNKFRIKHLKNNIPMVFALEAQKK